MSDGGVIEVKRFQFTHPVWGATKYLQYTAHTLKVFQFTHPVWGATTYDAPSSTAM